MMHNTYNNPSLVSNKKWNKQADFQNLPLFITNIKHEEADGIVSDIRHVKNENKECTFLSEQEYFFNQFPTASPIMRSEDIVKTEITEGGRHIETILPNYGDATGRSQKSLENEEENRSKQEYSFNTFLTNNTSIRPEEIVKTEIRDEDSHFTTSLPNYSVSEDPVAMTTGETRLTEQYLAKSYSAEETTLRPEVFVKTESAQETPGENLGFYNITEGFQTSIPLTQENSNSPNTTKPAIPDLKIHECHNCNYKTSRKSDMTRHQLTHQGIEAMLTRKVYECDACDYKSIRKCDLQRHKLVHKGIDDIDAEVYECSFCSYRSHRKNDLVRHTLIHKGKEEVNLFKCKDCPFQTKWKESFQQHVKTHMKREDLDFYQCEFCGYQTINKKHLRSHQLTHKSEEEVRMFNCTFCSYNSKRKCNLQRHLKTHTNVETKLILHKLL